MQNSIKLLNVVTTGSHREFKIKQQELNLLSAALPYESEAHWLHDWAAFNLVQDLQAYLL